MREQRTWKSLMGVDRWQHDTSMLYKHETELLWDKGFHNIPHCFFANPLGRCRQLPSGEPYNATYEDTNMLLGGQLGLPLIFETKQIRFYPGTTDPNLVEKWKDRKWKAFRMTFNGDKKLKLVQHNHLPLPEIDNFTKEEQMQGYIDLMEIAKPLFNVVNGGHLPCVVADVDMTFFGVDYLAFILNSDEKPIDPTLSTYAVLVGSMWRNR